jgi:tRNA(Ile)-lysidine synthase
MIDQFIHHIKINKWFSSDDHLLLAVSGGVDSMVLMDLISKTGHYFEVAHMNYQLRGADSDLDEELVTTRTDKYEKTVHHTRVETLDYARSHGLSIQMAARELRYAWFEKLMERHGLHYLLTAHHADDNLETTLFNLSRGSGLSGLRGILPKSGNKVRPLIFFSKEEIRRYASDNKLEWREDESNLETKYRRNLIRQKVVPVLKDINPALTEHFQFTQERLIGAESIVSSMVEKIRKRIRHVDDTHELPLDWITNTQADQMMLHELLKDYNFSYRESKQVFHALGQSGKVFYNHKWKLSVDREMVIISKRNSKDSYIEFEINQQDEWIDFDKKRLHLSRLQFDAIMFSHDPHVAYLDLSKIKYPMKLRTWRKGDRFIPLGMTGQKKVSDFLIDQKVPIAKKSGQMVLETDGKICWLVGWRIDDRFKIRTNTKDILLVTLVE